MASTEKGERKLPAANSKTVKESSHQGNIITPKAIADGKSKGPWGRYCFYVSILYMIWAGFATFHRTQEKTGSPAISKFRREAAWQEIDIVG